MQWARDHSIYCRNEFIVTVPLVAARTKPDCTMTATSHRLTRLAALAAILTAAPAVATAPGSSVKLAPHRAVYEMRLGEARQGSAVTEISGRMVFEFTGSECEGYTQNMRFVMQLGNRDGSHTVTDMRSSSWEESQGKRYRFNVSNYKDQELEDSTNGDAVRDEQQGGIKIDLTKPKAAELRIAGKIVFPVQHSRLLIEAAEAGQSLLEADIYDGSDKGEKLYATTALIGKPRKSLSPALQGLKNTERLGALTSWPMTISYYDKSKEKDKTDALPAYEIGFRFFANGVSENLHIDYGDFVITRHRL